MSDSIATATTLVTLAQSATQQALATRFVRQNAEAEAGVVALLEQGAEQGKAVLPPGQGSQVDRLA